MENFKQQLLERNESHMKTKKKEIEESNKELSLLEAELKVEKKLHSMENVEENLREDIKYSLMALEDMITMEKNRNTELQKDLKILEYRTAALTQLNERELES